MTIFYMNSATQPMTFLMIGTDHLTGVTGQSPVVRFSKAGATAFASATQTVTEMQYGWYKLTLATNNVDTIGELAIHVTATKGDDTDEKHYVGPVGANTIWWASATVVAPSITGMPKVDLQAVLGTTATTGAAMLGVNVYSWATATGLVTSGAAGIPKVDLLSVLGTTATTGAALLGVNVYSWATATGTVTSAAAGIPKTDLISIQGTTATTGTSHFGVNVYSWATATGFATSAAPGIPKVDLISIQGTTATTGIAHIGVNIVNAATVGWLSGAIASGTFAASSIDANALATSARDEIADQVWDELAAGHTATTSFGAILQALGSGADPWATALPGAYTATQAGGIVGNNLDTTISSRATTATQGPTAPVIADAVWDELAAGHTATTSFGAIVQALGAGADPWGTAIPGAYTATQAGGIVGNFLDIAVSSRSTATTAPTALQNADALLDRDMSAVSDSNTRSLLNAIRFIRNKWFLATTGVLTVYKENDTTVAWTATATGDSAAVPITGIDP